MEWIENVMQWQLEEMEKNQDMEELTMKPQKLGTTKAQKGYIN